MGGILLGFLQTCLLCAIVILIAYAIVWVCRWMGVSIDGNVYRWGTIVVGLICLIIIVGWLLSVAGLLGGAPYRPFLFR